MGGAEEKERRPSPEITGAQKEIRQQVFEDVLKNEGILPGKWEEKFPGKDGLKIDLREDYSELQEAEIDAIREGASRAYEVVLEEKRLVQMLRDELGQIQDNGFRDGLLEELQIPAEEAAIFVREIPKLIDVLEKPSPELFEFKLDVDEYKSQMAEHLSSLRKSFEGEDILKITQRIIEADTLLALKLLDNVRKNPVLSHRERGAVEGGDEASYEALKAALEADAAEIEFDIRMSKDFTPIIQHNATLGDSAEKGQRIRDLTDKELAGKKLKHGGSIATLKQFFALVEETGNKTTKINIDIKDYDEYMLDEVVNLIQASGLQHRVVIVSWLPQALQYIYEKMPTLEYSLSYPVVGEFTRFIFNFIQHLRGDAAFNMLGSQWIATFFAEERVKSMEKGQETISGAASETIENPLIVNPELDHRELKEKALNAHEDLTGRHPFPASGHHIVETPAMTKMKRILKNGSINLLSTKEFKGIAAAMKLAVNPQRTVIKFAEKCAQAGIKVNVFDLIDPDKISDWHKKLQEAGIQGGSVYSSNFRTVPKLKLRGQTDS